MSENISRETAPAVEETDREFRRVINNRASVRHREEEERLTRVLEAERRNAAAKKHQARRDATHRLLTQCIIAAVLLCAMGLFCVWELMVWQLVAALAALTVVWICIWVGAWVQFMWCKGGLLK